MKIIQKDSLEGIKLRERKIYNEIMDYVDYDHRLEYFKQLLDEHEILLIEKLRYENNPSKDTLG